MCSNTSYKHRYRNSWKKQLQYLLTKEWSRNMYNNVQQWSTMIINFSLLRYIWTGYRLDISEDLNTTCFVALQDMSLGGISRILRKNEITWVANDSPIPAHDSAKYNKCQQVSNQKRPGAKNQPWMKDWTPPQEKKTKDTDFSWFINVFTFTVLHSVSSISTVGGAFTPSREFGHSGGNLGITIRQPCTNPYCHIELLFVAGANGEYEYWLKWKFHVYVTILPYLTFSSFTTSVYKVKRALIFKSSGPTTLLEDPNLSAVSWGSQKKNIHHTGNNQEQWAKHENNTKSLEHLTHKSTSLPWLTLTLSQYVPRSSLELPVSLLRKTIDIFSQCLPVYYQLDTGTIWYL